MTATIQQAQDALTTVVETILPAKWSKVYGYRTAPEKHKRYAMVTYMGGEHGKSSTASGGVTYDFAIILFAQHDNSEAGKQSAEEDLNEAEDLLIKYILEDRSNIWLRAGVPFPTIRPRQPRALPTTRLAEIPIRMILL